MLKVNIFKIIAITLLLVGCGTANRKQTAKLKKFVQAGQLKKAEKFVGSKDFYPEKRDRLLKLLELGTIQYLNSHYYQSLKTFDKAKDLSDKLFTVSISKKVTAAVSNDNYDNYYGEKFERSMIRFYQSLIHLKLGQNGLYESYTVKVKGKDGKVVDRLVPEKKLSQKEKSKHLRMASNVLIEWNSLLDNYKSTTGGKIAYKADLLAAVYGAYVWNQLGKKSRAINLYKDAKNILFKNFNILETYNEKSKKFKEDYKKLPNMSLKNVKKKYVKSTEHAQMLVEYIDERIKELSKNKSGNLHVLIEKGFITPKKANKVRIPLPFTGKYNLGKSFVSFCSNVLSMASGVAPSIYFEIPEIPFEPVKGKYVLLVKDKSGKIKKQKELAVVNPLANLATLIMDEKSFSTKAKIGARLVGKHLAALAAAYGISKKGGALAGSLAYAAATKGIEASERADLRIWSLLPHHFRITSLSLPAGEYQLELERKSGKTSTITKLGPVTVKKKNKMGRLVTYRTY